MGTNPLKSMALFFLSPSQSLAWRACEIVGDPRIVKSTWGFLSS